MEKYLIKFWSENDVKFEKMLVIEFTPDEDDETNSVGAPGIYVSSTGDVYLSVKSFKIDYEKSGKCWFNDLRIRFTPDDGESKELGVITVWSVEEGTGFMFAIQRI